MRLMQVALVLLVLCACASAFARMPRSSDDNDLDNDGIDDDDDNDDDDDDIHPASTEPLPIASIKSRAIAMDRGLCKQQSRFHPHYPRCQEYCAKLDHWMGMCRRDSCHCYSIL